MPEEAIRMAEDKQKRYERNQRYKDAKTKQVGIRFFPADMDLYDYLQTKDNKMGYIKDLIRADMERGK